MNFEPKVTNRAAFVALWHNGELLVLQSRKWQTEGTPYLLPGGGCKPNETLLECVIRETLEEISISISDLQLAQFDSHVTQWSNCEFFEVTVPEYPVIVLEKKLFGYEWWNFEKDKARIEALKPFMMPGLKWYLEQKGLL